jgi:4-amino-4-deoxy-L-arabinose transferase-like glycosyltransferase
LLRDTVRRRFGEPAGLIAGLLLALTPVAVVIFRYNNPDALLILLTIAAVWAVLRAVEDGRTRWLLLGGVCVGLGYLTKQFETALVMPALAVTYLVAGPPKLAKRLWQLLAALAVAVVAAGWWVALVELWPVNRRPWIGGSQRNSILELTLEYNGFGRLTGDEPGSAGFGGVMGKGDWGQPGLNRLFQPAQVGQISWLLGAALIFFAVLLVVWRGAPRTDPQRASVLVWGLWLVVNGAVFSFMHGIFHAYYTVILAPAIAALDAIGVVVTWRRREELWAQATMAAAAAATVATTFLVLQYTPHYYPWLRWVAIGAVVVVVAWLVFLGDAWADRRAVQAVVIVAAAALALSGPVVYALTTLDRGNAGALPTAGPGGRVNASRDCNLLDEGRPNQQIVDRLTVNADSYTWVAATVGSSCASGYQLATGHPVMPIGGFNGSDPSPPLPQFERMVLARKIHYYIAVDTDEKPATNQPWHWNNSGLIQLWVQHHFRPIRLSTVTIYDLTL